ncbi:MAG: hypothetical protein P8Y60_19945, partial [Calditrichota bacterium]
MASDNSQIVNKVKSRESNAKEVSARQDPIRDRFREAPEDAWVVDYASTVGGIKMDAFHGRLDLGRSTGGPDAAMVDGYIAPEMENFNLELPVGIHRAIGGDHDLPTPGNLLSAALASC